MTKKIQFKGPVTKWEKRWVNHGHMKLLKWVPLKTKRPNPQTNSVRKEGGSIRQNQASLNMETRRSGRRDRNKTVDDHEHQKEIEMLYLSSLPKTRRTSRKIDQLQKKHLADAGISDDLQPSSADEKPTSIRTPVKKTISSRGVSKSMLSPSSENALGSDSEQPSTSTGNNTPNTTTTTTNTASTPNSLLTPSTTLTTSATNKPLIDSNTNTTTTTTLSSKLDKSNKMLDDDDDDLEDDSKLEDDDESSSSDDEANVGNTSVNDEDDEDDEDDIKPQSNKQTTTTSTNNTSNESLSEGLNNDKMDFDTLGDNVNSDYGYN